MTEEKTKVVIQTKGTTTTILPESEKVEQLTKAIYNIQETGLPSNDDLDMFGDQIITFFKKSKKTTPDEKSKILVEKAEKVVQDVKDAIQERNYDEKLQEISKKIKDEATSGTLPNMPGVSEEDAKILANSFKNMGPLLLDIGKILLQDIEIRKLIISLIDALSGATFRTKEKLKEKDVVGTLREDLMDTETDMKKTKDVMTDTIKKIPEHMQMTEDEKDNIIRKAVKALNKLRDKEQYRLLFEHVFLVLDELLDVWHRVKHNPNLKLVYKNHFSIMSDIREMVERSCGRSLKPLIHQIKRITDITEDEKYIKLRKDIETLITDKKMKYRTAETIKAKIDKIQLRLKDINDKYHNIFIDLFYETQLIIQGFANDPVLNQIRSSINSLIMEIFVDDSGKPSVNAITNAVTRIRDTFYPIIKDKITRISVPTIEFDSKKYFFRISDMKINVADLLPDQIKVESDFNLQIDLNSMKRQGDFNVHIRLDPFSADVEGLKFFIKKKSGIKYKDYGEVDLSLRDSYISLGLSVRLLRDEVDYIEVSEIDTSLKGLKVGIRQAKHDILDKFVLSVFLPTIRLKLENTIKKALHDSIKKGIFDRVNESLRELHYSKDTKHLLKQKNKETKLLAKEKKEEIKEKSKELKEKAKEKVDVYAKVPETSSTKDIKEKARELKDQARELKENDTKRTKIEKPDIPIVTERESQTTLPQDLKEAEADFGAKKEKTSKEGESKIFYGEFAMNEPKEKKVEKDDIKKVTVTSGDKKVKVESDRDVNVEVNLKK